jgi:hypothetical protein
MQPIPKERPLLWTHKAVKVDLEVPRAELEQRFGAPHYTDEEGCGLGPEEFWRFSCDCGLEVAVRHLRITGSMTIVAMQHGEVEHALAHLGLDGHAVVYRSDASEPRPTQGWAVVRQDDTGNRYDVCLVPVRAHAECFARMLEARAHKQSYSVEQRGLPPLPAPLPWTPKWAVIRQDELGNREQMSVFPTERHARWFVESYESEPRHKQTYLVEPVTPKS